jgi:hypothetical protein
MKNKLYTKLNLHLFEGEAPAAAESTGAVPEKSEKVQYGKPAEPAAAKDEAPKKKESETVVTTDTAEARKAEFERLIRSEYKDLFDQRVQSIIDQRFKQTKTFESQLKTLTPMLEMLAQKYGVNSTDVEALTKAIMEDDSYYEEEAMKKGLTVEQLKAMKKLERENAEFRKTVEEIERRQNAERLYQQWQQQAEALKVKFPNFDLQAECSDPETGERFLGLLKNGIDIETAFRVIHQDEIMSGAMQYTAQQVQQKVVNDIRARGMRPPENGVSGSGTAIATKTDPSKFTKKDREDISRRVLRGERIVL